MLAEVSADTSEVLSNEVTEKIAAENSMYINSTVYKQKNHRNCFQKQRVSQLRGVQAKWLTDTSGVSFYDAIDAPTP